MTNVLEELQWRGLIQQTSGDEALQEALTNGTVTYYCGFDPTAPSLHMGNLVQLIIMRHLQLAGHKPLALVGGATGLIGDPRMSGERVLNSKETVAQWVDKIRTQVEKFLSFEGDNAARMVNNLDWTQPLSALDFLRDIGKYYRMSTMLRKETIATRLDSEDGLSFTEFSYQILQGMDYLHLFKEYGCTLQTGGSDQWGNLTSGTDLIRKSEGKSAHALTSPIITKADGTKFGKSEGGAIWLDRELTSPYAFFQFWLNSHDGDVIKLLKIFTFKERAEIDALAAQHEEAPFKRIAHRALAESVTTLVHGADATAQAIAAAAAMFGGGELSSLSAQTLTEVARELPHGDGAVGQGILDAMVAVGLAPSVSAARRTVQEGGCYLNNVKVEAADYALTATDFLHGEVALLRRGKKNIGALTVKAA